jgi:hypothetical protein
MANSSWSIVAGTAASVAGQTLTPLAEGGWLVTANPRPDHDSYRIEIPAELGPVHSVKLEVLTHPELPKTGPGTAGNGNFVLTGIELLTHSGEPLRWSSVRADHSQDGYPIEHAIDGRNDTGWAINVSRGSMNVPRTAVLTLESPASPDAGPLTLVLQHQSPRNKNYLIGAFRISVSPQAVPVYDLPENVQAALAVPPDQRTAEHTKLLNEHHRTTDPAWTALKANEKRLTDAIAQLNREIPAVLVMEELPTPRESYVHIRGDFLSRGATVSPGTPAVLPELPDVERPNRLDLARWLVSDEQPLTARVTVNRVWQRLFGLGLVETENDFGLQGDRPTHPALLDWLAIEFREQGWSLKALHRLIVTSAVYRQSSAERPELRAIDPRNLLLARQNRLRLEAEVVRDVALAASGLLTEELFGPPVYPPQPEGIYILTQNKKEWPESRGPARYRRSLYTHLWRSSPHPMFVTFDAPDGTITCTRRPRSNTPLQALTLANDRGLVELAQGLASRMLLAGHDDAMRLQLGAQVTLARELMPEESSRLHSLLEAARSHFAAQPAAAQQAAGLAASPQHPVSESAAWTAIARVLINLDEFYTRE